MKETYLPLTDKQIRAMNKHVKNDMKTLFKLKLSKTQLRSINNNEKICGFLPLMSLIPAIGATV
jgi:hypothetical protein